MAEQQSAEGARIGRIADKVSQILTSDETIEMVVTQHALAGIRPDAVVLTNRRFILYREALLGAKFSDGLWRDLTDVHLSEGLLGATMSFRTPAVTITVDRLPKAEARHAYAFAQEKEQEAIETRRQRQMEEDRARAGHFVVGAQQPTAAAAPAADDPLAKLTKLKSMMDAGLITEEEYNQKKQQILDAI
jgi:hypothetical protein